MMLELKYVKSVIILVKHVNPLLHLVYLALILNITDNFQEINVYVCLGILNQTQTYVLVINVKL